MDRAEISRIAHRDHPIAAPVAERRALELLGHVLPRNGGSVLDLGCGQGAWLVRALEMRDRLHAVGVDNSRPALTEARREATDRRLADRVRWIEADAATWSDGAFDAVLCVGASHALGGLDGTLRAVRRHLRAGGRLLLGDTFWERPPTQAARDALQAGPGDLPDLSGLMGRPARHGFDVVTGHISTLEEWDEYEWSWTGSLVRWAFDEPEASEDREQALAVARAHREAWLTGYRGQLGFATLVLLDTAGA